ncbi:MAG: ribonuclease H-like domain-containing protein [Candidatus Sericytochromatia bacterium]|nr:ribonuclease H-like domain-containing protein [Candidatus Sericytochromatia bacterium]
MVTAILETAIRDRQLVAFLYASSKRRDRRPRIVEPYQIWVSARGVGVLLGYDRHADGWRNYRLERVSGLEPHAGSFVERVPEFDAEFVHEPVPDIVRSDRHPDRFLTDRQTYAYLDTEADGSGALTIVGLYRPDMGVVQLVGTAITAENLVPLFEGIACLYTYNGGNFDLPAIAAQTGFVVPVPHIDLLWESQRLGFFGGLKKVEIQLDIPRRLTDMDGSDAQFLWYLYNEKQNYPACWKLLEYNLEDTINLASVHLELLLRSRARDVGERKIDTAIETDTLVIDVPTAIEE